MKEGIYLSGLVSGASIVYFSSAPSGLPVATLLVAVGVAVYLIVAKKEPK